MKNSFLTGKLTAAILAGTMALASVVGSVAMPITAFAKEAVIADNPEDGYVDYISGHMVNNYGTVDSNNGAIDNNYGFIRASYDDYGVTVNDGKIEENSAAAVFYNNGEVTHNFRGGFVCNIKGTVVNNYEEASVFGGSQDFEDDIQGGGSITNNIGGEVAPGFNSKDLLSITNYYYGDISKNSDEQKGKISIVNDFSEENFEDRDYVTVDKKYHYVEVSGADNVSVKYDGFTYGDYDQKQYALVAEKNKPVEITASITIKPSRGYKIADDGQACGETDNMAYTLKKHHDGSYTVNIKSLTGNEEVTLDMLHLAVEEK